MGVLPDAMIGDTRRLGGFMSVGLRLPEGGRGLAEGLLGVGLGSFKAARIRTKVEAAGRTGRTAHAPAGGEDRTHCK